MRANQVRAALQLGKTVFGTMIQEFRNPAIAHILANAGYDFIFIDMEHGPFSLETVADLLKTIRLVGLTGLVRVPDGQYHLIAPVLDAGAEGVMVPRVEKRQEVEAVVNAVRYPPLGKRGLSITKGHNDYRKANSLEFVAQANRENLIILQIERKEAVERIDELLSVPGVDVALIGPNDLSLSLGLTAETGHPEMKAAIGKVVESAHRHGRYSGMHTSQPALVEWQRQGMQMLVISSDIDFLSSASAQGLAKLKQEVGV
jgi:2-dehydro-3-deoxyglucarate aldolase/4-hydroxy-2-oxoheptanedioate aldolase